METIKINKNNKAILILLILFIIFVILDGYSTLKRGVDIAKELETNPIVDFIGFGGLLALNIGFAVVVYFIYTRITNPFLAFLLISVMVMVIIIRIPVIQSNFESAELNISLEQAKQIRVEQKEVMDAQYENLSLQMYATLISFLLPFLFFSLDYKSTKKNG